MDSRAPIARKISYRTVRVLPVGQGTRELDSSGVPAIRTGRRGVESSAAGWLSGDFGTGRASKPRSKARADAIPSRYDLSLPVNQRRLAAVDEFLLVAHDCGLSIIQLAVGVRPRASSRLLGSRRPDDGQRGLEEDLSALEVRLTPDVLDRLDAIVAPGAHVGATYSTPTLAAKNRRRGEDGISA